jgi:fido (protein-threonine AMPylation protein)
MSSDNDASSTFEGANFSYIDFEADERPKWCTEGTRVLTVWEMVEKIVEYQYQWEVQKASANVETIEKVFDKCLKEFFYRMNIEDEHGCATMKYVDTCFNINTAVQQPLSKNQREMLNSIEAYKYLLSEVKEVENGHDELAKEQHEVRKEFYGLLTVFIVKNAHKLILKDIELKKGTTKAGEFSNQERYVDYNEKRYYYRKPDNMEDEVWKFLDIYNELISRRVKKEKDAKVRVYNMFKTCSWLLFELLDLHPFSDGSGRLCRLLCSYALSSMTPFPTPIYNVWSKSKKCDYYDALVNAREVQARRPTSLTTMIIENNYFGWQEFFRIFKKVLDEGY